MDERERQARIYGLPLTLESAKAEPDLFRDRLLMELGKNPAEGKIAKGNWLAIRERLNLSDKDITLDTKTWVSRTDRQGKISIGVQPLPLDLREKLLFEDESFDWIKEVMLRLSHEISHTVGWWGTNQDNKMGNKLGVFLTGLITLRKSGKGFSSLGNLEFYKQQGPEKQANEDLVELFSMYSWNPDYLRRYIVLLSDPRYKEVRAQQNLKSITPNAGAYLFDLIREVTEAFQAIG